jgi:hypothetical protein
MSNSIIDKTYKKLAIQVALDGLSFGVFDTLNSTPLLLKHVPFSNSQRNAKIEEIMELVYHDNPELKHHYDEIAIIHSNNLSTFVPTALFDEEFIGSYLQYNTKVFETDFFTYDALEKLLEKTLPGFGELFRFLSYQEIGSRAMASRAVAGVYQSKIIFSLPGSSNAVRLGMEKLILPELVHLVKQLNLQN